MRFARLQSAFAAFAVGWILTAGLVERRGTFFDVTAVRVFGAAAFLGACVAARAVRKARALGRGGNGGEASACAEDDVGTAQGRAAGESVGDVVAARRDKDARREVSEAIPGPAPEEDSFCLRREAACACGDYAAAAYWETMNNLALGEDRSDALQDIVDSWLAAGCPELDDFAQGLLSLEEYSLGMAVLDYQSGESIASALAWFAQCAAAGDETARQWLSLTKGDAYAG